MITETLDTVPLPAVLIITIIVVLSAIELGYRIGRWRSHFREFESEAQLSAITGANLALLAFMLAFSFSLAAGHHGDRKHLVLEEANTISTAHLRAGLVENPERSKLQALLVQYANLRATIDTHDKVNPDKVIADSLALQDSIWKEVQALSRKEGLDVMDSLLVQSINDLFDVHEERVSAAFRSRIPASLWIVLLILLTLSMLGMGNFSGMKGRRNPIASTTLALSFSVVMYLIADLDRPISGLVRSDQSAILELNNRLQQPPL